MSTDTIVDAEVVEGREIAVSTPATIFKTDDPMEIMQRTSEVATALKEFIGKQGLVSRISGRDYIVVEGWQMLGMMLGVTPGRVLATPVAEGWAAVVELHDRTGRVVGMGEAECLATERTWKGREDYARKSMAQTRAIAKAYRNTFGFIAKAAGFEATPAEEMPADRPAPAAASGEAIAKARLPIAWVIGELQPEDEHVDALLDVIRVENGGTIPLVALRAIARLANARKSCLYAGGVQD